MHIIDLKIDYHDSPRGLSTISCICKKKIILLIIICKFLIFFTEYDGKECFRDVYR